MAQYRLKTPTYDVAVFDGQLVGQFDPVFGGVVPRTCPDWFPALTEEVATLAGLEVVAGKFIYVDGNLFFGDGGKWALVEKGSRMLHADGGISVVGPEDFAQAYEPA